MLANVLDRSASNYVPSGETSLQRGKPQNAAVAQMHAVLEVGVKQHLRECGTKRQKAGS